MKEYREGEEALDICQKYEDRLKMADYCGDTVAFWTWRSNQKGIPPPTLRRGEAREMDRCSRGKQRRTGSAFSVCAKREYKNLHAAPTAALAGQGGRA